MKNFIVYNGETGEIQKTGICQDNDLSLQGEFVIEGFADGITQYIDKRLIKNKPKKPEGFWDFDFFKKQWVPNKIAQENFINITRNKLLQQSDWTQLPNNPLTLAKQEEWAVYRQQLRDITQQSGYPFNVIWPTQPE